MRNVSSVSLAGMMLLQHGPLDQDGIWRASVQGEISPVQIKDPTIEKKFPSLVCSHKGDFFLSVVRSLICTGDISPVHVVASLDGSVGCAPDWR